MTRPPVSTESSVVSRRSVAAVIAAGGTGSRISAPVPKQFLELGGKPILIRTVESVASLDCEIHIVVALPGGYIGRARELLSRREWRIPVICVPGGTTRQESVRRGVLRTSGRAEVIMVHDAARPLCSPETMLRVLEAAWRHGGAVPGLPATETIQRVSRRGRVLSTPPREELFAVQTPQCFQAEILRNALARAQEAGFLGTDESSVVRWAGHPVAVVPGSPDNIKITHPLDLKVAELLVAEDLPKSPARKGSALRIGQGIDYHRLVGGRKLILGGVEVPFGKGLEGHSDADVLAHAVCDALLGGAALGDIGSHFPETDARHLNRSSLEFLRDVHGKVKESGWVPVNIDATLLAQQPRLSPFFEAMRKNLADALDIPLTAVSIKATTTEGMNAEGKGEGISAQAVALLERLP